MKIVYILVSIVLVAIAIFLMFLNAHTALDFAFFISNGAKVVYNILAAKIVFVIFILGAIAGICGTIAYYIPIEKKLKEYQRKLEKTSVQSDEESSKVSVLQAKIDTLEKALQSALGNKGDAVEENNEIDNDTEDKTESEEEIIEEDEQEE